MVPGAKGYTVRLELKNSSPVAQEGNGAGFDQSGCRGVYRTESHTSTPPTFSLLVPLYGSGKMSDPGGAPLLTAGLLLRPGTDEDELVQVGALVGDGGTVEDDGDAPVLFVRCRR